MRASRYDRRFALRIRHVKILIFFVTIRYPAGKGVGTCAVGESVYGGGGGDGGGGGGGGGGEGGGGTDGDSVGRDVLGERVGARVGILVIRGIVLETDDTVGRVSVSEKEGIVTERVSVTDSELVSVGRETVSVLVADIKDTVTDSVMLAETEWVAVSEGKDKLNVSVLVLVRVVVKEGKVSLIVSVSVSVGSVIELVSVAEAVVVLVSLGNVIEMVSDAVSVTVSELVTDSVSVGRLVVSVDDAEKLGSVMLTEVVPVWVNVWVEEGRDTVCVTVAEFSDTVSVCVSVRVGRVCELVSECVEVVLPVEVGSVTEALSEDDAEGRLSVPDSLLVSVGNDNESDKVTVLDGSSSVSVGVIVRVGNVSDMLIDRVPLPL